MIMTLVIWVLMMLFAGVSNQTHVAIRVFSYNVKSGINGKSPECCWSSPKGNSTIRKWQQKRLKGALTAIQYDFVALPETIDEEGLCTKLDDIVPKLNGYQFAKQWPFGSNCQSILFSHEKWSIDTNTERGGPTTSVPNDFRNYGAARFISNSDPRIKIVFASIQWPNEQENVSGKYIHDLEELTSNGKYPIIVAGDFNGAKASIENNLKRVRWKSKDVISSENHITCCADNGWKSPFDHIAVLAKSPEIDLDSVNAETLENWSINDTYTTTHSIDHRASAEHIPIAGVVKLAFSGFRGASDEPTFMEETKLCGFIPNSCQKHLDWALAIGRNSVPRYYEHFLETTGVALQDASVEDMALYFYCKQTQKAECNHQKLQPPCRENNPRKCSAVKEPVLSSIQTHKSNYDQKFLFAFLIVSCVLLYMARYYIKNSENVYVELTSESEV